MSRQYALDSVNNQIAQVEALIETRARIQRLTSNSDFKSLINQRYIVEEAASFAAAAGDSALTPEQRSDALQMALAPGHLKRWLSVQIQMANKAEDDLPQLKHARDVLLSISDETFEAGDYTFDAEANEDPTPNTP